MQHNFSIQAGFLSDRHLISSVIIKSASKDLFTGLSETGIQTFIQSVTPEQIEFCFNNSCQYYIVHQENQAIGVIAIHKNVHIYHLFILPDFQRKGVGKMLWEATLTKSLRLGNRGTFTVNSSTIAFPFYQKLGFQQNSPAQQQNDVHYIPMEFRLEILLPLKYTLQPTSSQDLEFLYDLHKSSQGQYIKNIWGWDEDQQFRMFKVHFSTDQQQLITYQKRRVGVLQLQSSQTTIEIQRIQVLPAFQNKGIGTSILKRLIQRSEQEKKTLSLRAFPNNPAHRLYQRLGFREAKRTDLHIYMQHQKTE